MANTIAHRSPQCNAFAVPDCYADRHEFLERAHPQGAEKNVAKVIANAYYTALSADIPFVPEAKDTINKLQKGGVVCRHCQ
jgi:hypothetical protein